MVWLNFPALLCLCDSLSRDGFVTESVILPLAIFSAFLLSFLPVLCRFLRHPLSPLIPTIYLCLSVCSSVFYSTSLSLCISVSLCLSLSLPLSLTLSLSPYISVSLSPCLSFPLSLSPSVSLSLSLSFSVSVNLSLYLPTPLSVLSHLFFFLSSLAIDFYFSEQLSLLILFLSQCNTMRLLSLIQRSERVSDCSNRRGQENKLMLLIPKAKASFQ